MSFGFSAENPHSLLRRRCGCRKPEWNTLKENLEATLMESEDLVERYKSMGKKAWSRVQIGLKDLSDLRGKLSLHLYAIHAFMGSLTLSALGGTDATLGRIELILRECVKEERLGNQVPTVLSTHEAGNGPAWKQMKFDLLLGEISREDPERSEDRIKEILHWVVNNERDLDHLEDVDIGDSISRQGSDNDAIEIPNDTLSDSSLLF